MNLNFCNDDHLVKMINEHFQCLASCHYQKFNLINIRMVATVSLDEDLKLSIIVSYISDFNKYCALPNLQSHLLQYKHVLVDIVKNQKVDFSVYVQLLLHCPCTISYMQSKNTYIRCKKERPISSYLKNQLATGTQLEYKGIYIQVTNQLHT